MIFDDTRKHRIPESQLWKNNLFLNIVRLGSDLFKFLLNFLWIRICIPSDPDPVEINRCGSMRIWIHNTACQV